MEESVFSIGFRLCYNDFHDGLYEIELGTVLFVVKIKPIKHQLAIIQTFFRLVLACDHQARKKSDFLYNNFNSHFLLRLFTIINNALQCV